MLRSRVVAGLVVVGALALAGAPASEATTAWSRPKPCSGVIQITRLAFEPPTVFPGQSSSAHLSARNCTGRKERTSVAWMGRYVGVGGGLPPGCPAIDPISLPANFSPYGTFTSSIGYTVPATCTAVELDVTARFTARDGSFLTQRTAMLTITRPTPRWHG